MFRTTPINPNPRPAAKALFILSSYLLPRMPHLLLLLRRISSHHLPLRLLSTAPSPSVASLAAGDPKTLALSSVDDSLSSFLSSPSLPSLNALLFSCILSNNHRRAAQFLRDLPSSHRIQPNLLTYNTVIRASCESGGSGSFYSYLHEMARRRIKPNLTTFSIALAGFYREGRPADVNKVLWLMRKHGRRPGALSIYNVRVQCLCKLRRPDEGKELLREMEVRGVKPSWVTYDHLVLGFCCAGNLDEAKRMFEEMGRRGLVPQSGCYFTLVHYLCKAGDFGSALRVCRESMERNWVPRVSTMVALVEGLAGASRVEEAREIVEVVKGKFSRNVELWKKIEEGLPG